jgi:hypothetical protein
MAPNCHAAQNCPELLGPLQSLLNDPLLGDMGEGRMADKKESFRARSLGFLPEKVAWWPAAFAIVGAIVFLLGFGISAEFQGEFPWFKKITRVAGEPSFNSLIAGLGAAMFAIAIVSLLPLLPVQDKDADKYWPRQPRPQRVKGPILLMDSPLDVDLGQILAMISRFGRGWPSAEIRWPHSSTLILEGLERARKEQHKLDVSSSASRRSKIRFLEMAPKTQERAKALRKKTEEQLPGLVKRSIKFDDQQLGEIVRLFLVRANYEIHQRPLGVIQEVRQLGFAFDTPKSWDVFRDGPYDALYGESGLWTGRLVSIGEHVLIGEYGPGISLRAKRYTIAHRITMDDRRIIPLVAQLEWEWVAHPGAELPPRYEDEWCFATIDKTGRAGTGLPGEKREISTCPKIEALLTRHREAWEGSGAKRSQW